MTYPTSPRTRWPAHSAELRIASTSNGGQRSDSPLPEVARQRVLGARRPITDKPALPTAIGWGATAVGAAVECCAVAFRQPLRRLQPE